MKAGTTWLYSLLERHPQIHFTPEKEIHFLAHHYLDKKHLLEEHRQHRAKKRLGNIDNLRPERQEIIRSWYHDQYLYGTHPWPGIRTSSAGARDDVAGMRISAICRL